MACSVGIDDAGKTGIARHLSTYLGEAAGRLQVSLLLDFVQDRQKIRRAKLGNGSAAKVWKGQVFQSPDDLLGVFGRPGSQLFLVPFTGHHFKGLPLDNGLCLLGLALLSRIYALPERLLHGLQTRPGFPQTYSRIDAQGKPLLFSGKAIFDPPPLAPAGGNFQIKTTAIRQLVGFFPRLRAANGGIRELSGHWGQLLF